MTIVVVLLYLLSPHNFADDFLIGGWLHQSGKIPINIFIIPGYYAWRRVGRCVPSLIANQQSSVVTRFPLFSECCGILCATWMAIRFECKVRQRCSALLRGNSTKGAKSLYYSSIQRCLYDKCGHWFRCGRVTINDRRVVTAEKWRENEPSIRGRTEGSRRRRITVSGKINCTPRTNHPFGSSTLPLVIYPPTISQQLVECVFACHQRSLDVVVVVHDEDGAGWWRWCSRDAPLSRCSVSLTSYCRST